MRVLVGVVGIAFLGLGGTAPATPRKLEIDRDILLRDLSRGEVAQRRMACATGQAPAMRARIKSVGWDALSAGQWCVTVLTRAGRDGTLRHVALRDGKATPAIAFDAGFVTGYIKREALPADAPAMMTLLPIADRCLDQKEADKDLCGAAGHMLGARAARGELIPID
ncbi:hypothetical protein V2I08_19725 [Sphingobium sp. MK2]